MGSILKQDVIMLSDWVRATGGDPLKPEIQSTMADFLRRRGAEPASIKLYVARYTQIPRAVKVTDHAIDRWIERTGSKARRSKIRKQLSDMAKWGVPIQIKEELRLKQLLNHNCAEALYLQWADWILVVEEGKLKTLHRGEAGRWERVNWNA